MSDRRRIISTALIAGACAVVVTLPVAGANVVFTGGSLLFNGSASDGDGGDPTDSALVAGTTTPTSSTGNGSTGSGLASATGSASATIAEVGDETLVTVEALATASVPPDGESSAFFSIQTATTQFTLDPLIVSIPSQSYFRIASRGDVLVTFLPVTGSIQGNKLAAGTYSIAFSFFVLAGGGDTTDTHTIDWTLRLSDTPIADLDGDGLVNGLDLGMLLAGWNTASADIDGDGTTNGADLGMMLAAWGS